MNNHEKSSSVIICKITFQEGELVKPNYGLKSHVITLVNQILHFLGLSNST